MRFSLTEEQQMFREAIESSFEDVDADDWKKSWRTATQLGVLEMLPHPMHSPDESLMDFAVFAQAAGRYLIDWPWLETALWAPTLASASDADCDDWLTSWSAGERLTTVAWEHQGSIDPFAGVDVTIDDSGITLRGGKHRIPNTSKVDSFVVAGRTQDEPVLVLVPLDDGAGITVSDESLLGGPETAAVHLGATRSSAVLLARGAEAEALFTTNLRSATLMRCFEMLGGARAVLDSTVSHVTSRYQFNTSIGSFQAVKHQLASVAIAVENLASTAYFTLDAVIAGEHGIDTGVAATKAYANQTYVDACNTGIQLHGGFGYTWEAGVHRYLKHARTRVEHFGSTESRLGEISRHLAESV